MPLPANTITYQIVPSGGIVALVFGSNDTTGTWTITREGNGQTITLYSGPARGNSNKEGTAFKYPYLDIGDGTNLPLASDIAYTYTFASTNAPSASVIITPACNITIQMDGYLSIFLRCLQAGLNNIALPISGPGLIRRPNIQIAMPLTAVNAMPIISVAPVMMQQDRVPIGHGANTVTTKNEYDIYELVLRRYTVSVFAETTLERDFYTVAIITIFKAVLYPLLNQMGQDVHTSFSAHYSQVVDVQPGFYYSEVALEFTGNFIAKVTTDYLPILGVNLEINVGQPSLAI